MSSNLLNIIDEFPDLKIVVIGEAMLDSYLTGSSDRLCREAPVPVVDIEQEEHVPGGAANTAVNVASLGGQAIFLSVTGADAEAHTLRKSLKNHGVVIDHMVTSKQRATIAKQRVVSGSQMVVRFDQGTTDELDEQSEAELIEKLEGIFPQCDALIVSDYNYGIVTPRVIEALSKLQKKHRRLVVVDSKRLEDYREVDVTAIKPNYREAVKLLDLDPINGHDEDESVDHLPEGERFPQEKARHHNGRVAQIFDRGEAILKKTGARIAAVTLDKQGALIFERSRIPYRTYANPGPNSRAAGAGDTYMSAFALALAAGAQTESAAELASAASTIVVGKDGTSTCHSDELRGFLTAGDKYVPDVFQLAAQIAVYHRKEQKIVFTNGCFDIIHRGHINYLSQAKALGDILIVGLNSDESVKRLKGPKRPINPLEDRAQVLAALSCVDHIVAFDDDTPMKLIRAIQPDIFVKGGDYTRETLPEADLVESLGGKIEILPYLEDHSTTGIIERIREIESVGSEGS